MAPGAPPNNRVLARLLLAISAGLLLLLHLYEPPAAGLWTQTLFNSMHVPVFGIVALSLYVATGIWANWGLAQRAIGVCIAALALSILSETAQIPGPRDASVKDLISDWLGAAAALVTSSLTMGMAASSPPAIPASRSGMTPWASSPARS